MFRTLFVANKASSCSASTPLKAFRCLARAGYSVKANREEAKELESPEELAQKSKLKAKPIDYSNNAPVNPKKKRPFLSGSKYESRVYQLPKWKEALGEIVIRSFNLDMDKVRAGPVAGSYYYALCKEQGLQFENEPLSTTARFFYEDLKLPRTFSQWFQITILHEWILFVRMRAMPFKYGRNYQQKLVDRTFSDIELRLFDEMNVNSGRIADQYLKDFNSQLRGAVFAYDEGLFTDDSTLAAAIWRNLFGGRKNVDMVHLEATVRYVRAQIYVLSKMSDREFAMGKFKFVSPDETVYRLTAQQEAEMKENVKRKYEEMDRNPDLLPSERSKLSYDN
ncbi:Cbp3p [Lachancea thermotolerans CBS 6340]|uniref:KLTH0H03762p n=1 Tax=Lachancea thermotolerans (strain ATCC 56472 / CBS 6340 / NRRL Y-8284) TaxID=559295 RepID=C5E2C2_LACTC|nr:KLTH0H03762p [Lachancea thermotolerans CBS 6340]CAR30183.1 KLTH0H03762p [Lachancea thermotolerans CBS 6340]